MMKRIHTMQFLWVGLICSACGGSFLDMKPNIAQRVPVTLPDFTGLMDNSGQMNTRSSHHLGIIGSDEIFIPEARYHAFPSDLPERWQINAYTWEKDIFVGGEGENNNPLDWNAAYERILWANLVLEGVEKIARDAGNAGEWDNTYGMALFHRAVNHYQLAQLFCVPYDPATAIKDLGIPLRLESDLTVRTPRASMAETYRQIADDLAKAASLLPDKASTVFRPGKNTVLALLTRLRLQQGDYSEALRYAGESLAIGSELLDYNLLDLSLNPTFIYMERANPEITFMSNVFILTIFKNAYFNVDPSLYALYDDGDLRKTAFFTLTTTGNVRFKGSYGMADEYTSSFFTGMSTAEMLLVRAECNARLGNTVDALTDLNHLRKHRFAEGLYTPLNSRLADEVLDWILEERRRELVLRGVRWEDLRRLNRENAHAKVLVRNVGTELVELAPGSARYTWPIPVDAMKAGGYQQNER